MDFFNLDKPTSPTTKTQAYGRKVAKERAEKRKSPPLPEPKAIVHRRDLFLDANSRHTVLPDQQDLSAVHSYFKKRPMYDLLPICPYKERILKTIEQHSVTIITAPTGSGKSTRVPQYILDNEYYNERRHCNIVVTQPRRVAAISLARRVLDERGLDPIDYTTEGQGTLVGYQIGMDRQVNEDTRLVYMTTGVLLRKLCHAGNLNEFTHIILDEVHERDKETDFLLLLVKKFLCSVSKFVKVVVMSATVNADKFAKYFSSLVGGVPRPCPTIEVRQEAYPVVVMYLNQFKHSIGYHMEFDEIARDSGPAISDSIYSVGRSLIESFDAIDKIEHGDDFNKGTVLVFLPGIYEIETFQRYLTSHAISKEYDIIALHSSIPRASQMRVFREPTPGRRKVILSTNIAESSITVPDIRYVVDFCLTKQLVCDPGSGMSCLQCTWAPRSSLDQRKGRAGRVAKGRCYRLIDKSFISQLGDFSQPEITRCSLENLILWCKILDIGEPQHMMSLALDPPDLCRMYESTLLLEECGALLRPKHAREPFSGDITFLGQVMGTLPLDVRLSRLVMFGYVFSCFTECIIIAACLALPAFLEVPYNNKSEKLRSYVCRMKKAAGTFSDPIMMLHVYNAWYEAHSRDIGASKSFCTDNYIEYGRIQEVASLIQELNSSIHRFNIPHENIEERKCSYQDETYISKLKLALAAANYPNYFIKDKDALHDDTCMQMFGNRAPADTVMFHGMTMDVKSDEELQRCFLSDVQLFFQQGGCDNVNKLSLEGSRMYVTFNNPAELTVCKSVYYALKMKKLGINLSLFHNTTDNRYSTATYDPHPLKQIQNLGPYPHEKRVIPIIKGTAFIKVTHVISPTKFFAQFIDNEVRAEWEEVQHRLQLVERVRIPYANLKPKSYAACYYDDEFTLYRVRLEYFRNEKVRVYYVDYGDSKDMAVNKLFQLPDDILRVPFQAIECSLENVAPCRHAFGAVPTGGWSKEVCEYVESTLLDLNYTARIHYVMNDVVYLDVLANGQSFKEVLLEQQRVCAGEPDYRVKQARTLTGTLGIRLDTAFTVYDDDYVAPYQRPNFLNSRANLSGGSSPYEVSFKGLCDGLAKKSTSIDPTSVNSIILHHNTSVKYQELLSASSVALSNNGDKIHVRGSTSHQPLPGLAEIMVLLFAPQVQLQCSPGKLNYTGCIGGLGTINDTPIWPEHDIKLHFDVRIDNQDIGNINKLRMYISDLLRGDEDNPTTVHLTHQPIRQLQRKIWRLVQLLLQKRRELLPPPPSDLQLVWEPPSGTENTGPQESIVSEEDIMKPIPALQAGGIVLETQAMSGRVKGLIETNYKIEQTTGLTGTRTLCELCGMQFEKTISLAVHLNGADHAAEKLRLDHWTLPGR